jgi:hypothetical protein
MEHLCRLCNLSQQRAPVCFPSFSSTPDQLSYVSGSTAEPFRLVERAVNGYLL